MELTCWNALFSRHSIYTASLVCLVLLGILLAPRTAVAAPPSESPPYLQSAVQLLEASEIPYIQDMWPHVSVSTAPSGFIALAQYTPFPSPKRGIIGRIKIGSDLHRYKKEFNLYDMEL